MKFTLVNKSNMGIVIVLILIILLSQSKIFDILFDTYLGRLLVVLLIVCCAYCNKVIGLVAILFIVIAFNYFEDKNVVHSYNYYEGFDVSGNLNKDIKSNDKKIKNSIAKNIESKINTDSKDKAREGFCMSDRELIILRGKQSNSVSVYNKSREQSEDIIPSEKSIFDNLSGALF
jgi:hypothetical protein